MGIVEFVVLVIVLGLLVWLEETYLPLAQPFRTLIRVAVIILLVVVLLSALGIVGHDMMIPRLVR